MTADDDDDDDDDDFVEHSLIGILCEKRKMSFSISIFPLAN